jgi:branched-chain amino acid transport system permease protein
MSTTIVQADEPTAAERPTVHRWTTVSRVFTGSMVGLAVLLIFVPYGFTPDTTQKLTSLFVLVIMAAMWNALAGFGGLVSVGQQAFIGVGAYATIWLTDHGMAGYPAIVVAALIAGAFSVPISFLVFRLRGGQFAIGMWVVAEAFRLIVINTDSLGGGTGRSLTALRDYEPAQRAANTYWLALAAVVVLIGTLFVMLRSRLGASLQAIRDDEVGAAALGVRVTAAKRVLFVLSAVGCGIAGSLTLANTSFTSPNAIFAVDYSAFMIFMVLVGGLGTFEGPIIGALILFGIQQQWADQGAWYLVGLGVTAIVFALVLPRGIWGTLVDKYRLHLMPVGYRVRERSKP